MKVYFDNAATTPTHPKVYEKMLPYLKDNFGNPSSIHLFGRKVKVAIEDARETVADFIHAKPGEIYFVSGGTESNNFALFGISKSEYLENKRNHIITSKAEHLCVLDSCKELEKIGFEVTYADITNDTNVVLKNIIDFIKNNTFLISLIHINNETGAVNNIEEISKEIEGKNIFVHTDAVQSFGKVPIDINVMKLNALSASGHKIYGPKGIGILYVKSGTPLSSIIYGGSQERNRRGGTENVAGIIGFTEAVKIAQIEMQSNKQTVKEIKKKFITGLHSIDEKGILVNGGIDASPYILNLTFDSKFYKNDVEAMLMFLDIHGVAVSNGAACTSGTLKPSHVLLNSGKSREDTDGTIRFSFGPQNTLKEVEYTLDILDKMVKKIKK